MQSATTTYEELHREYTRALCEALYHDRYSYSLTGIDLTAKWDACSELALLRTLQRACIQHGVATDKYAWCTSRMHDMYRTGACW